MNDNMLTLYRPLIDWITLTSFHEGFPSYWMTKVWTYEQVIGQQTDQRRLNYYGDAADTGTGTIYIGTGLQKERTHYMMQIGGESANDNMHEVYHSIDAYQAKVTTIDLQITVPKPQKWSQFDFLARMHDNGRIVGWHESRDKKAGEMESVYMGSWDSLRFSKVYVKLTAGNEKLLRYEVRYKRDMAQEVINLMKSGRATLSQLLKSELMRSGDMDLRNLFEGCLSGIVPIGVKVKQTSSRTKQREWLLNVALPALKKYVNSKDSSPMVIRQFLDVLEYGSWHNIDNE